MSPRPGTSPNSGSRPKRHFVPGMPQAWSMRRVTVRSFSRPIRPRRSRSSPGDGAGALASIVLATLAAEQRLDFRLERRVEALRVFHHEEVAVARESDGVEFRQHLADARLVHRFAEIR